MIRLEFNGKPFDPQNFTESLLKAAMESVASEMHDKVSAIRHPVTGEFPTVVVFGTSLDDINMRIEGSPELLALVNERLGVVTDAVSEGESELVAHPTPKVFLSYASEDKDTASLIAHTLQANGIDTWWDEWCISAGDSLRQKIDEGLGDCSHFVVLLTPNSIIKPWVNLEIDSGLMLKLKSRAKFIPLRNQLPVEKLSPLLQGMLSPCVDDPERDISQLINDIHGVTKKPALGKSPVLSNIKIPSSDSGYSAAANAIAKFFVTSSEHAMKFDPWVEIDELIKKTGLSEEDVIDAVHELRGMITVHSAGSYYPENELFATFDCFWMPWDPKDDALTLATDMLNKSDFPTSPELIAEQYGWNARRLNPAMAYLINRKLVRETSCLGCAPWLVTWLERTDETRRFIKSRQ